MATIVVGIEDSLRGEDAVALASALAQASGAEVLAICAYPYDPRPAAHYNPAVEATLRTGAQDVLARLCDPLRAVTHVRTRAVADPAPAHALLVAAMEEQADMIVVGSSHVGFSGHVFPGTTAHHLLQGAPCAVALAPQGQRLRAPRLHGRVSVGFDGSRNARAALRAAVALAAIDRSSLRVITVFDAANVVPASMHAPPGYLRDGHEAEQAARAALDDATAGLDRAEPAFLVGDAAGELVHESRVSDWLVIGSRGYGPTPAVLLGDVGEAVVHAAECPVLVVPNGVATPLPALCGKVLTDTAVCPGFVTPRAFRNVIA